MKVILVAEHASIDFGGEAALPCHYFRILLSRNIDVCLIVHERSKPFLDKYFSQDKEHIFYIKDSWLHRFLHSCLKLLPSRLGGMTFGFALRMLTQILQKRVAKKLIRNNQNTSQAIVHQVIPVSPKEPSLFYGLGVPVIFGPLNGGMYYPEGFGQYEGRLSQWSNTVGRAISKPVNYLFRGKLEADIIFVSNDRTKKALPTGLKGKVVTLVENGVDLSIWNSERRKTSPDIPSFIYVGRLVDWKAVDILIDAFFHAYKKYGEMNLHVIGDGDQRSLLEKMVSDYGLQDNVIFHGWVAQTDISPLLVNSRALVLPSLYECGGAVVLEAMACSVSVVATNWGGPADYIDSSCGILVEPTSRKDMVNGFSNAISSLASDILLAQKMGESGRKKIEEQYDWEKKVDDVFAVYQKVLNKT